MKQFLSKYADTIAIVFLFAWPFLFLLPYVWGDQSFTKIITLDVIHFYYPKVFFLDCVSNGRFPLWSPGESAGFPFYSSPFNQVLYPLNIPLVLYYKLAGGFSWIDYQRYSILGISLSLVFLYKWLRRFSIPIYAIVFSLVLIGINFKLVGILNRAPATHSFAWMCMILWGMTEITIPGNRKKGIIITAVATLLLLTTVYPYYLYYCIFLVPFYGLLLMFPRTRSFLLGEREFSLVGFVASCAVAFITPLVVCIPYLLQVKRTLGLVNARADGTESYLTDAAFYFHDMLGSLAHPAFSDMRGWYYMGAIVFMLLLGTVISIALGILKERQTKFALACLFGVFAFVSLISNPELPFLGLFQSYFPGFKNFRAIGRINILLIPFLALAVAKCWQFFCELFTNADAEKNIFPRNKLLLAFGIPGLLLMAVQMYLIISVENSYLWKLRILSIYPDFNIYYYSIFAGIILMLILFLIAFREWIAEALFPKLYLAMFACLALLLSCVELGHIAIEMRSHPVLEKFASPFHTTERRTFDFDEKLLAIFQEKRLHHEAKQFFMIDLFRKRKPTFSVRSGVSWWSKTYSALAKTNSSIVPRAKWRNQYIFTRPLKELMGINDGERLFFSKNISYKNKQLKKFIRDKNNHQRNSAFEYDLLGYNGDELIMVAKSKEEGWLSFIDNHDKYWKAQVNGEDVEISKLFDTFKSIKLNRGINNVRFYYDPPYWRVLRKSPELVGGKEFLIAGESAPSVSIETEKRVEWENPVGAIIEDNFLICKEKVSWGYAGAASTAVLGRSEDGAVVIEIRQEDKVKMIGLAKDDIDYHYESIDYALHFSAKGQVQIFEKGKNRKVFEDYKYGDVFSIQRTDNEIFYVKNGAIIYRSAEESQSSLIVDCSMISEGAAFSEVFTSF